MFKLLGMFIGASFRLTIMAMLSCAMFFFVIGVYTQKTKTRSARNQIKTIAEDLDSRVTPAGTYIAYGGDVMEFDAWGTPIEISYTQEGVGEVLTIRSAGPDKKFDTNDDIRVVRRSPNIEKTPKKPKKMTKAEIKLAVKNAMKAKLEPKKEIAPPPECGEDDE